MKMLKNDGGQTQLSSPSCCSSSLSLHSNRAKILFVIGLNFIRSLCLWNLPPSPLPPAPPFSPLPQDMKLSSSHLHLFLIAIYSAVFQSFSQPQPEPQNTAIKLESKTQSSHPLLQLFKSPQNKPAEFLRFHKHVVSFNSDSDSRKAEIPRHRRDINQDTTSMNPDTIDNNNYNNTGVTSPETDVNSTLAPTLNERRNETDVSLPTPREDEAPPPFECSQLDDLFPDTLPDGTKDDKCSYYTDFCGNAPKHYEGKQLYGEPCATLQDLMSIIKRLPLGTSNRDKNLLAQSLQCNKTKSLQCFLEPDGKLTADNNRETLYLCGCKTPVGRHSYSQKTGKCFIPFGESIIVPCDMAAEEAARHKGGHKNRNGKPPSTKGRRSSIGQVQDPNNEILLCREDLECGRKSISKTQGNDSLADFHCYCPEGKEIAEEPDNGTRKCVKVERSAWKQYFRIIIGIALSVVSFSIIFGGILHVELSDPRPGIASRGFRRKPPKLLTAVSSINLNLLDLSVASDESKLLLSQDQPSDV